MVYFPDRCRNSHVKHMHTICRRTHKIICFAKTRHMRLEARQGTNVFFLRLMWGVLGFWGVYYASDLRSFGQYASHQYASHSIVFFESGWSDMLYTRYVESEAYNTPQNQGTQVTQLNTPHSVRITLFSLKNTLQGTACGALGALKAQWGH